MKKVLCFKDLGEKVTNIDIRKGILFTAPTREDFGGNNLVEAVISPEFKIQFFDPRSSLKDWDGGSLLVDFCEKHDINAYVSRVFNIYEGEYGNDFSFIFCPKRENLFSFCSSDYAISNCRIDKKNFALSCWTTSINSSGFELSSQGYYGHLAFENADVSVDAECNEDSGEFVFPLNDSFTAKIILTLGLLQTSRSALEERYSGIPLEKIIVAPFA